MFATEKTRFRRVSDASFFSRFIASYLYYRAQKLQAMDNSHVALVAVLLKEEGFMKYRCDRPIPLGVNLGSLTKVLKCAKDDDVVTLKAGEEGDVLNLTYEGRSEFSFLFSLFPSILSALLSLQLLMNLSFPLRLGPYRRL